MKVYAYAWWKRSKGRGPGNWKPCGPKQVLTIISLLRRKGIEDDPPIGEVIPGNLLTGHYDYICVRLAVPEEVYDGLEEV